MDEFKKLMGENLNLSYVTTMLDLKSVTLMWQLESIRRLMIQKGIFTQEEYDEVSKQVSKDLNIETTINNLNNKIESIKKLAGGV